MSLICMIGLHKWREEVVLRQTFAATTINYDADVCTRCGALRDPEGVADAYAVMANMRGEIEIHPMDAARQAPQGNAGPAEGDEESRPQPADAAP